MYCNWAFLFRTVTLNLTVVIFRVFRPHSTDSATHRKMTLSLADRCSKTQKIRILPMAGRDPESHRNEMIKVTRGHGLSTERFRKPQWPKRRVAWGQLLPSIRPGLHKDITWRAYIMRSHSGQWNGNSVSKSGKGGGGWLCINCQPKHVLLIAKITVSPCSALTWASLPDCTWWRCAATSSCHY